MDTRTPLMIDGPGLELERGREAAIAGHSSVRVLLVEDDYDSVRLVSRRLNWSRLANFEVSWAASLAEALEHLEKGQYDAIVLDLSLPGSEGVATIAGVSAIAREIPIVVLTGSDSDQLAVTASHHGVQDYLVKENQDNRSVVRAVLAAIERQRRETASPASAAGVL